MMLSVLSSWIFSLRYQIQGSIANLHFSFHCQLDGKRGYKECKLLSQKISSVQDLPSECFEHDDLVSSLKSRPTKSDSSVAFEGMGNASAAAIAAREKGQQNYAQIQRRFTNSRRFTKSKN
jgi:hypothetical protein